LSQTISARSQVFSGAESSEESTSFLKKEAKNLCWLARTYDQRLSKEAKVFWFFFSKKNILPFYVYIK